MSRAKLLFLLALASSLAPLAASAADWRICAAMAFRQQGPSMVAITSATKPFDVEGIADWQAQFQMAQAAWLKEKESFLGGKLTVRMMNCSDRFADVKQAEAMREQIVQRFVADRKALESSANTRAVWQEWAWKPTRG